MLKLSSRRRGVHVLRDKQRDSVPWARGWLFLCPAAPGACSLKTCGWTTKLLQAQHRRAPVQSDLQANILVCPLQPHSHCPRSLPGQHNLYWCCPSPWPQPLPLTLLPARQSCHCQTFDSGPLAPGPGTNVKAFWLPPSQPLGPLNCALSSL